LIEHHLKEQETKSNVDAATNDGSVKYISLLDVVLINHNFEEIKSGLVRRPHIFFYVITICFIFDNIDTIGSASPNLLVNL
jgi:phage-related holin